MGYVRKTLFLFIFLTGIAGICHAQVDQRELQRSLAPVTFYNNDGPQERVDSREQIRRIGADLGRLIKARNERAGAKDRYFVIRSVSAPDGNKLDADIFGLGSNVGVDHISNLRLIIQGYLQEAYDYSEADAVLLAEYITIYNAVYRGYWSYFSGRFKKAVIDNLNQASVGLPVWYKEWPGGTLLLIPLRSGGLSTIDTSAISDSRVIERMQVDDNRGIPQRQGMADLKEREAEQAKQEAEEKKAAVRNEESAVAKDRQSLEEERRQLARDRQRLEEDKASGRITGVNIAQKEAELARREAEAATKSNELVQRQSDLAVQKQEAARQEQFAEQKKDEARQDRGSIAAEEVRLNRNTSAGGSIVPVDSGSGVDQTQLTISDNKKEPDPESFTPEIFSPEISSPENSYPENSSSSSSKSNDSNKDYPVFGGLYFQGWHKNPVSMGLVMQIGMEFDMGKISIAALGEVSGGFGTRYILEGSLSGMGEMYFSNKLLGIGLGGGLSGFRSNENDPPRLIENAYIRLAFIFRNNSKTSIFTQCYFNGDFGFGIQLLGILRK
jgi:hypothetical protein